MSHIEIDLKFFKGGVKKMGYADRFLEVSLFQMQTRVQFGRTATESSAVWS
jgi:hypothetical protein